MKKEEDRTEHGTRTQASQKGEGVGGLLVT